MTAEQRLFRWIKDMVIISVPFWLIFIGGTFAPKWVETPLEKSNIFILFISLHFLALHLLFMFGARYSLKYRRELYYIMVLIVNNLVDAIGNYFPQTGLSFYKLTINELIIDGIVLLLFIRKGYLNYKIWSNG